MKQYLKHFILIIGVFLVLMVMLLIQSSNINKVYIYEDKAQVIINFLMPMDQEEFEDSIKINNSLPYANEFKCNVTWLSDQTVQLIIVEESFIKGQSIDLIIDKAPTTIGGIYKSIKIPIHFNQVPELLEGEKVPLIATTEGFNVRFNTPVKKKTLLKYMENDIEYDIEEAILYTDSGKIIKDTTNYIFTPKEKLENGQDYKITFKAGMTSKNGAYTSEDLVYDFKTAKQPIIESVSPANQSNWIGLYPKFSLKTDSPIVSAKLILNGEEIEGELVGENNAYFYPQTLLAPDTTYTASFEAVASTGEKSDLVHTSFKTVPVNEDRIWIEVVTSKEPTLNVYKGLDKIKSFTCAVGTPETPTEVGTFYLLEKADDYFDIRIQQGANMCLKLSEGVEIVGLLRDPYWNIKDASYVALGKQATTGVVMLSEEDMTWLYQNIPLETMVVIHP